MRRLPRMRHVSPAYARVPRWKNGSCKDAGQCRLQDAELRGLQHVTSSPVPVIGDVLFTENEIKERLRELAADVDAHYEGRDLVLLGVLRGALMVTADLARLLKHDRVEVGWVTVSSYGSSTSS